MQEKINNEIIIKPQEGPQEDFLATSADIAFYGGAAGGGKSYALLLEPLRHFENKKFRAVIFRRTYPQVRGAGGLWDESLDLYRLFGSRPKDTSLEHYFGSGAILKFGHLEHEKNKYDYQGAAIPFIGFDELTQFTESQFFYLLSRNRSMSGVPGYIRATCNPNPDSWVKKFIGWYLDKDGFPIKPRCGKIRYFIRDNDKIVWGNSKEELTNKYGKDADPKSFTFIAASIYDNKILMKKDPTYLSSLKALPLVERKQLLDGNWNIRPAAGLFFKREYFPVVDIAPSELRTIRYWDRAATEKTEHNNPDWTVGLKVGRARSGMFYVMHMSRFQKSPGKVEENIKNIASIDSRGICIGLEQEPGASGKAEISYYTRELIGYALHINAVSKDKITRSKPASSQAEAGNIRLVRGNWNEDFLDELENFPEGKHDDIVDTLSGSVDYFYKEQAGKFLKTKPSKPLVKRENSDTFNRITKRIKVREY